MKRDIDLARQLLLDIEGHGADCSVSVLRTGPNHDSEEQVRNHLRLLIDAGLLKEVDQTNAGVPCVRLTYDGHELVELARSETRWREAKWACHDRTGGLSLTVIRGLLARWALAPYRYVSRGRPYSAPVRRRREYSYLRPAYQVEPVRFGDRDWWFDDESDYVRVRSESVDRPHRNGFEPERDAYWSAEYETSLPDELI